MSAGRLPQLSTFLGTAIQHVLIKAFIIWLSRAQISLNIEPRFPACAAAAPASIAAIHVHPPALSARRSENNFNANGVTLRSPQSSSACAPPPPPALARAAMFRRKAAAQAVAVGRLLSAQVAENAAGAAGSAPGSTQSFTFGVQRSLRQLLASAARPGLLGSPCATGSPRLCDSHAHVCNARIACSLLLSGHLDERWLSAASACSSSSAGREFLPEHHTTSRARRYSSKAASGTVPAGEPIPRAPLAGTSEPHSTARHAEEPVGAGARAVHGGGGDDGDISDQVQRVLVIFWAELCRITVHIRSLWACAGFHSLIPM